MFHSFVKFPTREISLESFLTYCFCLFLVVSGDVPNCYWEAVKNVSTNGELTFDLCRQVKEIDSI